jgi:hypothetical protein
MTDLFNSPVLLIEQPNSTVNYQITDPHGAVLAHAGRVGSEEKGWFRRTFAGDDMSRLVVQVAGPDGAPLFFLDRSPGRPHSVLQPPCAIVAPDGQLIGRVEHNSAALGRSYLQSGGHGIQQAYRLFDAGGQPLGDVMVEPLVVQYRRTMNYDFSDNDGVGDHDDVEPRSVGGRYAVYTDMNGLQIATVDLSDSGPVADRFILQIGYRLPDPLRVLVIASPIAIDLMTGA